MLFFLLSSLIVGQQLELKVHFYVGLVPIALIGPKTDEVNIQILLGIPMDMHSDLLAPNV